MTSDSAGKLRALALAVVVGFTVFSAPGVVGTAAAAGNTGTVSSCTTISSSGVYQLSTNVASGNVATCIEITASDVTLEGNGHTIDGADASNESDGIRIAGASGSRVDNVTLVDVTVTGWGEGVNATNANNTTLRDVTANDASVHAIAMTDLGGTTTLENVSTTNGSQGPGTAAILVGGQLDLAPTRLEVENVSVRGGGIGLSTNNPGAFDRVRAQRLRANDTARAAFLFQGGTVKVSDATVRNMADGESGAAVDLNANSGRANVTGASVANVGGTAVSVTSSSDIVARRITVSGATGNGLSLHSSDTFGSTTDVADVRVTDIGFIGVEMSRGYGVNMNNVTVRNASRNGINIGRGGFFEVHGGGTLDRITVSDVANGHGVEAHTGSGLTLSRTRVTDVDGNGLNLSTPRESPLDPTYSYDSSDDDGHTVYDSRVTNVSGTGLSMFNDGDNYVRNVTVRGADHYGIDVETSIYKIEVEDVRAVDTGWTAIKVQTDGSGAYDKGVMLTNVTVNASDGHGIHASPPFFDGANSEIDGADVVNATVWNADDDPVVLHETGTTNVSDLRVGPSRVRDAPFGFDATVGSHGRIEVRPAEPLVAPPARNRSVFRFVQFRLKSTTLDNVTVEYADADAGNLDETALRGWVYNDTGWTEHPGSVDTNANVVRVRDVGPTSGWVTVAPLAPTSDPEPTYGALSVDKTRVLDGEPYNVSVDITNDGSKMVEGVVLTHNGEAATTRAVVLAGSTTQTVTVRETFYHASTTDAVFEVSTPETTDSANVTVADGDAASQPEWTGWNLPPDNANHDPGLEPPRPPLSVEWNTSFPEPASCCVPMKPLVVNDTLYAYTYEETFAMDAETGAVLWNNTDVEGTYLGGIAYDDGRLFVSTPSSGLVAVNATTGTVIWNRSDIDTYNSAPVVLNGTVFVGDETSTLWAVDPTSGATVWNYTYASNELPSDFSSPTAVNGRVFVPGSDGSLYAHDATGGSLLWNRSIGYSEATVAVNDGVVYAGDAGQEPFLHALDADTGQFLWNASAGYTYTGLSVTNETVFVATCGDAVYAYDADTGALRWEATGVGCAYDISEPVTAEGVVYATNYDNETLALDADTGEVAYRFEVPGGDKPTSPVPYNGTLYFAKRYDFDESTQAVYALSGPEWPRVTPQVTSNGASTELTVLPEHGDDPITNATVVINGTTLNTGTSGTVNHTFTTVGTKQVRIYAPDTANRTYVNTTRTVFVEGPTVFAVTGVNSSSPVVEGETLTVNATVENTGGSKGTQTVTLSVNGSQVDSQPVTLDIGETTTVTLSWATKSGDAGSYDATVASDNESANASVTVQEPPNFTVTTDSTNSPVTEGDSLSVTATVENTGDATGTQTVSLSVGGSQRDSTSVTLTGGASTTVTLSWPTAGGDAGSYTATVASADDTASTSVTVESPSSSTATPTPTDTPTDPSTPEPTDSPTATPTATPEPTDPPTATPEPTDSPTPEPTDSPTTSPTETPTASSTDSPAPTSTDTSADDEPDEGPTATATPTSSSTPGFGVVVALIALGAAALLSRRRG